MIYSGNEIKYDSMMYNSSMSKNTTIIGAFIIVAVLGFFGFSQYKDSVLFAKLNTYFATNYTQDDTQLKKFTISDVANHGTESDCYTVIHNYVYDLTLWVSVHPGGKKRIISLCGKDGTEKFTEEHGGKVKYETILSHFRVGKIG
jgi:cytochrome b involved in lipid metabolism